MQWDRVKILMDKNGLTSKEIAAIAGVVPSSITKWKAGASIRTDALMRIAIHFGVSSDWLLGGSCAPPFIHDSPAQQDLNTLHRITGKCTECEKKQAHIDRLERIIDKLTK